MSTRAVQAQHQSVGGEAQGGHQPERAIFNPNKTNVSASALNTFITSPLDNDTHIPGLGAKCATAFLKHEINSVYMVVGKFLMFRDANSSSDSACQAFFNWLGECELPATGTCKHSITRALAEKLNLMIPGFYDNSVYSVLGTR